MGNILLTSLHCVFLLSESYVLMASENDVKLFSGNMPITLNEKNYKK
jgi:hypothetical protein